MRSGDRYRVTMLVRNAFTHDSRVEKEARSLTEAGHAITVVAEGRRGLPSREERDGYRVLRVPRPAIAVRGLRLLAYLRLLEAELVATAPQVLHAHDSDALSPVASAARRLRIPFVLDAHELWLGRRVRGRSAAYGALFQIYYRAVERRHVSEAAAHITVSAAIAQYLQRRYGVDSVLVPNYPELEAARSVIDLRSLPGGEGIPSDAAIILHIGSAMPGRGVPELIRAMEEVPEGHLVLLGPGPAGDDMRRLALSRGLRDRVHILEPVPTSDVVAAASAATIGVAPIIPETPNNAASMPNKLFQYLAAGLPVVVSALPQLQEVIHQSGAGVTVDSRNPQAISAAIRELLADRPRLAALGRHARTAFEDRYNWSVSATALIDVYDRLPSANARRRRRTIRDRNGGLRVT